MEAFIYFLERIGSASLDFFWLPVLIWTAIALLAVSFMRKYEHNISAAYQYYNRVALLWGLAVGVIGSVLLNYFPIGSSGEVAGATGFIVIQNPITVTATAATSTINWWDPALWIGTATMLVVITAAGALIKLVIDFISLNFFSKNLSPQGPAITNQFSTNNKHLLLKFNGNVNVIYCDEVDVPCTFGWLRKRIVLPTSLRGNSDKLNMALRHELTHILNNDYLLNSTVQSIKALFFFHPLVHQLNSSIEEYREIFCDQYVLQDAQISQKNYAKLLFELSPKPVFKSTAAVNMAVHFSTLKKRIQTMKTPNPSLPSFKWSMSLMVIATLMITGLMACSDIEEGGITQAEVEDAQVNMAVHFSTLKKRIQTMKTPNPSLPSLKWSMSLMVVATLMITGLMACSDIEEGGITQAEVEDAQVNMDANIDVEEKQPLYILNGEESDPDGSIMARLKPKYIESINVLKGDKAIEEYGEKGKNGVVKIKLRDKEKALEDLRSANEMEAMANRVKKGNSDPDKVIFMAVEDEPKLKGGLREIQKHVNYPKSCRQAGIEGRVTLQFIVNKEGNTEEVEILRGIGGGCDEAAIEAVEKYAKFEPGKQRGQAVNVQYSLPISFKLQ